MFKHTSPSATPQVSLLRARIARAIRRHLVGMAVGGALAAVLVAPAISLAATPRVHVAPPTGAHTLLVADGPNIWGCGGTPTDC